MTIDIVIPLIYGFRGVFYFICRMTLLINFINNMAARIGNVEVHIGSSYHFAVSVNTVLYNIIL